MDNRLDYVLDILKSFKGHAGRKGLVGGSLPKAFGSIDDAGEHFAEMGLELVNYNPFQSWSQRKEEQLSGKHLEGLKEVASTMKDLMSKYDVGGAKLTTIAIAHELSGTGTGGMVMATEGMALKNGGFYPQIGKQVLLINPDVLDGTIGMEAKYLVGGQDIKTVVTHEFGHVLHTAYREQNAVAEDSSHYAFSPQEEEINNYVNEIKSGYIKEVGGVGSATWGQLEKLDYKKDVPSLYALSNYKEFLAESFTGYCLGVKLPKEAKSAYDKIFKGYEKN